MRTSYIWAGLALLRCAATTKPNFVVILTDDQDQKMGSMEYMAGVKTYLTNEGTTFLSHYCTVSLCCPSRVNMWTGKAAHNTNVTDLNPPYGGYPKFIDQGWNTKWLPVWLQQAGYHTYFAGKLMNAHSTSNYLDQLNNLGLDGHDFMIDPGTYQYFNTTMQHNNEAPKNYPGIYATDLLANRSLDWLDIAASGNAPFFLAINPVNPHGNFDYETGKFTPPLPADRYADLFSDLEVPRTENFNPDVRSGASWVYNLDQLTDEQVSKGDVQYRRRLQALQAVDDLVNRTITRLDELSILDNTYVIYTSDNGFHIGQHRLNAGKRCPYEEDINVPLVIRGPGIPKGATTNLVTTHTDITPSILNWAGATSSIELDGAPVPIPESAESTRATYEHAAAEFWGIGSDDVPAKEQTPINTYKAVRVIGQTYSLYYSVWCDGSHEVYDMTSDALQMKNLYNTSSTVLGVSMEKLQDRLDALTLVLKTCSGETCLDPWAALQPDSGVHTIRDALAPDYDDFYRLQPKVSFEECAYGYFVDNELPIHFHTYNGSSSRQAREAAEWVEWMRVAG